MSNDFPQEPILLSDLALALKLTPQGLHKYVNEHGIETKKANRRAYLDPVSVRLLLEKRGYQYPNLSISFQMLKGGVGKTTAAFNLGFRANQYGAKVLFIDLDQQGNLSRSCGVQDPHAKVWVHLLSENLQAHDIIMEMSPTLHLIPSNLSNAKLESILREPQINTAKAISLHIGPLKKHYDLIIMDTAPNLSAINTAATCASDKVILPVDADPFAFDGLKQSMADINGVKDQYDVNFQDLILFTKFDGRENASREMLTTYIANYREKLLNGFIRTSTEMKNAVQDNRSIFSRKSTAKEDYDLFVREIMGLAD